MKNGFTLSEGATHVDICHNNRKAAFTLAEVLITLGIIGVVAALTMPTVIKNYQKQVTISKLKKNYTIIQQVLKRAEADFQVDIASLDDMWNTDTKGILTTYFLPYLSGAKISDYAGKYVLCYTSKVYKAAGNYQYAFLKGDLVSNPPFHNNASMILKDGTCIGISSSAAGTGRSLFIDINGANNPPNTVGKDLFIFVIRTNNNLVAPEFEESNNHWGACSMSARACSGWYCSTKIIKDGWKISDDYPW